METAGTSAPKSVKTRYRGLRKQTAKLNMMFAIANLILADRSCLASDLVQTEKEDCKHKV